MRVLLLALVAWVVASAVLGVLISKMIRLRDGQR